MKKKLFILIQVLLIGSLISTAYSADQKKPFTLKKGKTALIIVDMQNEFVRDGGLFQTKSAKATFDTNKKLIEFFRKNGIPVVYTKMIYSFDSLRVKLVKATRPDLIEAKCLYPGHKRYFPDVKKELDVTDIVEEIYPQKGDYIIEKYVYDAFQGTYLDNLLHGLEIENVVVTGTTTHCCVESTAKGAFSHDFKSVIVSDAISTYASESYSNEILNYFARLWGRVMTTDEVIKELSQ